MGFDLDEKSVEVVSLKEWLITLLILCVPLVNLVMIFVWAFNKNTNPSKSNYFKAYLIFAAIEIVVIGLFWSSLIGLLAASCVV